MCQKTNVLLLESSTVSSLASSRSVPPMGKAQMILLFSLRHTEYLFAISRGNIILRAISIIMTTLPIFATFALHFATYKYPLIFLGTMIEGPFLMIACGFLLSL